MALARLHREVEDTVGKGDCAFNAFTLAICSPRVLVQIERNLRVEEIDIDKKFTAFIEAASNVLCVEANWHAVKSALLELRESNKFRLQILIAPVMRQLTHDLAMNSPDAVFHKANTIEPLMTAFNNYCRRKKNKPVTGQDDLFSRPRFSYIQDKFAQVYRDTGKDKMQKRKAIENWWWAEGYERFQEVMARQGTWAGDLELARLAKYFNVVLDVVPRAGFVYNIHGDYGRFPFLTDDIDVDIPLGLARADVITNLMQRDVLSREGVHEDGVDFRVSEMADIRKRIDKVPHYRKVYQLMEQGDDIKGKAVPEKWPKILVEELIQRNVIGRSATGKGYSFSVGSNEAMLRINEIPYCKQILKLCREYYKVLPSLVLYKTPDHWENTIRYLTPGEQEQKEHSEKIISMLGNVSMFSRGVAHNFLLGRNNSSENILHKLQ